MKVGALISTERKEERSLMSGDPQPHVRRTFLYPTSKFPMKMKRRSEESVFVRLFLHNGVINRPLFL